MGLPKIRIVSDGTPLSTKVIDIETGENLNAKLGVRKIWWEIDAQGMAVAHLELLGTAIDAVAEVCGTTTVHVDRSTTNDNSQES